jgi:hypothetical protein
VSYSETSKNVIALGIEDYLDDFAARHNAQTWKQWAAQDPLNWKKYFLEYVSDLNNKIKFNLDGVDVWGGVNRSAAGRGGATDWELLQIRNNPQWWDRIEFIRNGQLHPNPFR